MIRLALGTGALLAALLQAQPPTAGPPVLTDEDRLIIEGVVDLAQVANTECNRLVSSQKFEASRTRATRLFEKKYPGFTLHQSTLALVPKPPARPAPSVP